MSSGVPCERLPLKTPTRVRAGKVLVILSWGAVVWYRTFLPRTTVGELRCQLAKELGRLFDGDVVGLELFITGTDISPSLSVPLRELTHPPYRNVCLDVSAAPRSPMVLSNDSVGERLLRKHMSQERFQAGVDQLLWRLVELQWPSAIFGIRTISPVTEHEIAIRVNFERYPTAPPVVEFWSPEAGATIEPPQWTEHLIALASTIYPEFADMPADSYCLNLLRVSAAASSRLKRVRPKWDVTKDLTQLLSRASACSSFRNP